MAGAITAIPKYPRHHKHEYRYGKYQTHKSQTPPVSARLFGGVQPDRTENDARER